MLMWIVLGYCIYGSNLYNLYDHAAFFIIVHFFLCVIVYRMSDPCTCPSIGCKYCGKFLALLFKGPGVGFGDSFCRIV